MPTGTFFRLPEEKRRRLLDAAWEEMLRVRFSDMSVNRIIHQARIPRGSFYQYFADKDDLVRYLLEGVREYFTAALARILQDSGGDLFAVPERAFDRFMSRGGATDPMLSRCIQVARINPGLDFQNFLPSEQEWLAGSGLGGADLSRLRRPDPEYLCKVFFLMIASLAFAIMETLRDPEQWERQREILHEKIEIIRHGSLCQTEGVRPWIERSLPRSSPGR